MERKRKNLKEGFWVDQQVRQKQEEHPCDPLGPEVKKRFLELLKKQYVAWELEIAKDQKYIILHVPEEISTKEKIENAEIAQTLQFLRPVKLCPCGCGKPVKGRRNKKYATSILCASRAKNQRVRDEAKLQAQLAMKGDMTAKKGEEGRAPH